MTDDSTPYTCVLALHHVTREAAPVLRRTSAAMSAAVGGRMSRYHEAVEHKQEGCELLSDMEVRRLIRKPLHPARPIRRSIPGNGAVCMVSFQASKSTDHCRDGIRDHYNSRSSIGNLQEVFKDPVTEKPPVNKKKERITYTREVLMQLSTLSVCKEKPVYLPDLPITLPHPISVQSSIYWMYQKTSLIHEGRTSQLTGPQASAADVLVPDTTGHLQRSCGVQALMRQSC